jgi:hypothetical protein
VDHRSSSGLDESNLTPEQYEFLNVTPQDVRMPGDYDRKVAKQLYERGLCDRAWRVEKCGMLCEAFAHTGPDGSIAHKWSVNFFCGRQIACKNCKRVAANDYFNRYSESQIDSRYLAYIEVLIDRSPAEIQQALDVAKWLRAFTAHNITRHDTREGKILIKVLFCDELTAEQRLMLSKIPAGRTVQLRTSIPSSQFKVELRRLVDTDGKIVDSPKRCAELDHLYTGRHLLQAKGFQAEQRPNAEKSVLQPEPNTDFDELPTSHRNDRKYLCPHCGALATHHTGLIPLNTSLDDAAFRPIRR